MEEEFLNKLADLLEEYEAGIGYTTDDDGIHIQINDKDLCVGLLDSNFKPEKTLRNCAIALKALKGDGHIPDGFQFLH